MFSEESSLYDEMGEGGTEFTHYIALPTYTHIHTHTHTYTHTHTLVANHAALSIRAIAENVVFLERIPRKSAWRPCNGTVWGSVRE